MITVTNCSSHLRKENTGSIVQEPEMNTPEEKLRVKVSSKTIQPEDHSVRYIK